MANINNDIDKAREIRDNYQAYNVNTVEELQSYDPKRKIRFYKKTSIDPNAVEFKKKFIEPKNKRKPKQNITSSNSKPTVKPTVKSSTDGIIFKPESNRSKIYELHLQGLSSKEISEKLQLDIRTVYGAVSARKNQLGIEKIHSDTFDQVKKLHKKGISIKQISDKLGKSPNTISYHISRIDKTKPKKKKIFIKNRICCICEKEYIAVGFLQNTCSKECRRKKNAQLAKDYRIRKKQKK